MPPGEQARRAYPLVASPANWWGIRTLRNEQARSEGFAKTFASACEGSLAWNAARRPGRLSQTVWLVYEDPAVMGSPNTPFPDSCSDDQHMVPMLQGGQVLSTGEFLGSVVLPSLTVYLDGPLFLDS